MRNILLNLLALIAILSSVLVITVKNPVISVLYLISVFINTAGYLILTGIGYIYWFIILLTYLIIFIYIILITTNLFFFIFNFILNLIKFIFNLKLNIYSKLSIILRIVAIILNYFFSFLDFILFDLLVIEYGSLSVFPEAYSPALSNESLPKDSDYDSSDWTFSKIGIRGWTFKGNPREGNIYPDGLDAIIRAKLKLVQTVYNEAHGDITQLTFKNDKGNICGDIRLPGSTWKGFTLLYGSQGPFVRITSNNNPENNHDHYIQFKLLLNH